MVSLMGFSMAPDGSYFFTSGLSTAFLHQRPSSTGRATLRSKNPTDEPIILNDSEEIRDFIDSIMLVRKVLSQPALAEYISGEMIPCSQATSVEALEKYVRAASSSCFNPCGTCRMGDPDATRRPKRPDSWSSTLSFADAKACGLKGLSVVDASVMPSITSGHIHAPTLMIAERAADFITAS